MSPSSDDQPQSRPKRIKKKIDGWVILDKPLELQSTKAVGIIRRVFSAAKAGHSGTLDLWQRAYYLSPSVKQQRQSLMLWMPVRIIL